MVLMWYVRWSSFRFRLEMYCGFVKDGGYHTCSYPPFIPNGPVRRSHVLSHTVLSSFSPFRCTTLKCPTITIGCPTISTPPLPRPANTKTWLCNPSATVNPCTTRLSNRARKPTRGNRDAVCQQKRTASKCLFDNRKACKIIRP